MAMFGHGPSPFISLFRPNGSWYKRSRVFFIAVKSHEACLARVQDPPVPCKHSEIASNAWWHHVKHSLSMEPKDCIIWASTKRETTLQKESDLIDHHGLLLAALWQGGRSSDPTPTITCALQSGMQSGPRPACRWGSSSSMRDNSPIVWKRFWAWPVNTGLSNCHHHGAAPKEPQNNRCWGGDLQRSLPIPVAQLCTGESSSILQGWLF